MPTSSSRIVPRIENRWPATAAGCVLGLVLAGCHASDLLRESRQGPTDGVTRLTISTQPSAAPRSGVPFEQQPVVRLENGSGIPLSRQGVVVTAAIASGSGTASLASATSTTDTGGVATFEGLTLIGQTGDYTLEFAAPEFVPVTSGSITLASGPPSALAIVMQPSESVQSGTAFPRQPLIQLRDAMWNEVHQGGTAITTAIASGGGTLAGTRTVSTDASGVASFTDLAVTGAAGPRTLRFSATGLTAAVSDTVRVSGGGFTPILAINDGNNQSATVGTPVATPPSVVVRDPAGNPVSGVAVTFAVASGGGSVTGASQSTNASGIARVGSWTLGSAPGTNTLQASATGVNGSPVTFTASATSGAAASIAINDGNNQTAAAGTAVATAPSVIVRDQAGNPVAGVAVTFAVASGGGSVAGANQTTSASGIARAGSWTLGSAPGTNTLRASATGLSGSPVIFTATGTTGQAASITINDGNNQTAAAGTSVATSPSVIVRDQAGNPVSGVAVTFAVASGGGSVTGANQTTSAGGVARVGSWILGSTLGTNTLRATANGLVGSPVIFTATATTGAAASIAINDGNNQTATAGTAVATSPSVIVRDQSGNPVAGVPVTFAVASGGGSVTGPNQTTNASGIARVGSWTLGTTLGTNTLRATAPGLSGSPLTFTATATAQQPSASRSSVTAAPATITASSGAVAATIIVTVRDAGGNPIGGATVTLAASGTGNTITQPAGTTNANGQISGTLSSTKAETKTVTATVNGTVAIDERASVTVLAADAIRLVFTTQPTDTRSNRVITPHPVVTALDVFDNVATGFTGQVTMSIMPGTGTPLARLSGTLTVRANAGSARFTDLSIDLVSVPASPYRLSASASGLTGTTSAPFHIDL